MGRLIIALAVIALLLSAGLYFLQRSLLFPIPLATLPLSLPINVEKITLEQGHALFVKASGFEKKKRPLIIYAHGNAEVAHWSIESLSRFTAQGFHLLLLEYPGYAGSPGSPSYRSIEKSALAAFDKIAVRKEIDNTKIVV